MSENNELFKGVPTPKSAAAASTDTGNVKKVEAEADDTRTRKTVKLSAAGMMPNLNNPVGRLNPEDLAVAPREVPPAQATEKPAESPTIRLRPQAPMPKVPGAAPAAASTDTGSVKKVDAEADDTRTRRTVRISAASVERRSGGMPMPSAGIPTPPPAAPAAAENKPKLTMPTPAAKPAAPAPAAPKPASPAATAPAPAAPAAEKPAEAPAAEAAAPAGGRRGRKKSGGLNLVKDDGAKAGPSRVANDMAQIAGKSAGSSEASPVYTVLAIITVLVLIGTLVLSSQYLNVWSPEWAAGFTLLK